MKVKLTKIKGKPFFKNNGDFEKFRAAFATAVSGQLEQQRRARKQSEIDVQRRWEAM